MKDVINQELAIGDTVAFSQKTSTSGHCLCLGIIVDFCKRSTYECAVIHTERDIYSRPDDIVLSSTKIVKLDKNYTFTLK